MTHADDHMWMRRALQLAAMAGGNTSPNPMVGAVVVHQGRIIGEGYHRRAGMPHAEATAIAGVKERSLLTSSTLYVNLEPCSHHGRTPPCTDLIISSGIPRVVTGAADPNPIVAGNGIMKLREAGTMVTAGVEEKACRWLNRRYFTWHEKKRPYVILKWARSADGFIDICREPGSPARPNWITGKAERVLVHRWRATEDAIMAGGETVRTDNPSLTTRLWTGKNPVRVIVSKSGELAGDHAVFDDEAKTILFSSRERPGLYAAEQIRMKSDEGFVAEVMKELYNRGIQSVMVEGGAFIISSFLRTGLWDEARRFTGTLLFEKGIPDPFPDLIPERSINLDKSILDFTYHF